MSALVRLVDYQNPHSLGSRLRQRRSWRIADLIDRVHAQRGRVRIADLGGREVYWRMFGNDYLDARGVQVTLINLEPQPEPSSARFSVQHADATTLAKLPDLAFDLVHSNSTIEHVGTWENMEGFAREVRRLASSYYVQTPYYWFPIEPHTLCPLYHWLPEAWRARLSMRFRLGSRPRAADMGAAMRQVRNAALLDRAQFRHLFPDADIAFEWLGPLPKSMLAVRAG